MNYQQALDDNNPKYGESGDGVKALQTSLNQKYQNTPGYMPLKVDGLYGPITQAAAQRGNNNLITTSSPARYDVSKSLMDLNTMRQQYSNSDGTADVITNIGNTGDESTKMLISTINANKANRQNEITNEYKNYEQGLQLLGKQTGQAFSSPDLLQAHIQQSETEKTNKLTALDNEQRKSIAEALSAKDERNYKLFKEKMDYIKEIKKEKTKALTDLYTNSIKKGTLSGLTPEQLNEIEVGTGLPVGILSQIKSTSTADPIKMTTRNDNGKQYIDAVYKNSDGSLYVKSTSIGNVGVVKKAGEKKAKPLVTLSPTKRQKLSTEIGLAASDIQDFEKMLNDNPKKTMEFVKAKYSKKEYKKIQEIINK